MTQKAFCSDFERLKDSESDLATAMRTIPEITDGEPTTDPPEVEAGTLEMHPTPDWETGDYPYLIHKGYLYLRTGTGVQHVIAAYTDLTEEGYEHICAVYALAKPGPSGYEELQVDDDRINSFLWLDWVTLKAEFDRMRAGIVALNDWAATVEGSEDNSEAREAIAECLRRLDTLESAIAETVKKWRQH